MRNKDNKHLGIEMNRETHNKLHFIAKHESRSANGQIMYLVRKCIAEFEEENGTIWPADEEEK